MTEKTCNECGVRVGDSVLICHPAFGSLVMKVKKLHNDYVEGLVWVEESYGHFNMPDDYHGYNDYMNFPISCIRKNYGAENREAEMTDKTCGECGHRCPTCGRCDNFMSPFIGNLVYPMHPACPEFKEASDDADRSL